MKPLQQDELFQNLGAFLKTKGIEIKDGSYAQAIQKSCGLLSDAINLGQQGFERAKAGIDKKLDDMRQVIHEKTAPRPSPAPPQSPPPPPPQDTAETTATPPKTRPRKKAKRAKFPRK
jgi:hypothetical protein